MKQITKLFLKKSFKVKLFLFLIAIWLGIAVLSVGFNAVKTVSEVKEWAFLSDDQKRQKLYGDIYRFFVLVNKNSEQNSEILFYPKDEMSFYLARYYLYPRIITRVDDDKKLQELAKTERYSYIITFHPVELENYQLVNNEFSQKYFYKRK